MHIFHNIPSITHRLKHHLDAFNTAIEHQFNIVVSYCNTSKDHADTSTGFRSHKFADNYQAVSFIAFKIEDKLGQGSSSVSTVYNIAAAD